MERKSKEQGKADSNLQEREKIGAWSYDVLNDKTYWSDDMYTILGIPPEKGVPSLEEQKKIFFQDDYETLEKDFRLALIQGTPYLHELHIIYPDESVHIILNQGQGVKNAEGKVIWVFGTTKDITEQRKAEMALKESQVMLDYIEERSGVGSFVWDLRNDSLVYSRNMLTMVGLHSAPESLRDIIASLIHPDDKPRVKQEIHQMISYKKTYPMSFRISCPDGTEKILESHAKFLLDEQGNPIKCIGIHQDITEREKKQSTIQEQFFFQQTLMNAIPMPVFYKNLNREYLGCNKAFEDFIGLSKESIIGKTVIDIVPKDFAYIYQTHDDYVFRNQKFDLLETQAISTDGTLRDVLFYKAPFFNRKGDMEGIIGVIMDITEHKQLKERLNQTEKMQALGQFAGGIAHDFNNQLLCIMGHAEMISLGSRDENIRNHVKSILKSAEDSAEFTRKLLAFARKEKLSMSCIDIHSIIDDVTTILKHSIDKRISIQKNFQAINPRIMGNTSQVQNALMNLTLNGKDAMPEGGELVFSTENMQIFPNSYPGLEAGCYIKISIKDTGVGMDSETLKHVFEPFYTTKDKGKGTGMGLTSAYSMAVNHHGHIQVQSQIGKGTTFFIYLPTTESAIQHKKITQQFKQIQKTTTFNIMVVDDEEAICGLAMEMLTTLGYQVVSFKNPLEAVEYYETHYNQIDLVILDMIMPVLGGKDTFIRMKKIHPKIKAILSSGFSLTPEVQEILDLGMISFLEKPYRILNLGQKVEEALKK
ncbi:MAG: PAS domain-containing protein [Candidatus Brocadiae bacterium]|nr:PAS domain-containing protein [Candidatus Brocadiia bacterium]